VIVAVRHAKSRHQRALAHKIRVLVIRDSEPQGIRGFGAVYPAYGSILVRGSSWFGGHGVNVYSNGFADNVCQTRLACVHQCVELMERFFAAEGFGPPIPGNANELYESAKRYSTYYERKPNGSGYIPVPGDAIVLGGGQFGHVVVVSRVAGTTVYVMEQNASPTGEYHLTLKGSTLQPEYPRLPVIGIIHAKKNTSSTNKPPTPVPSGSSQCSASSSTLSANTKLCVGKELTSPSFHDYSLVMQSDGNLVLYSRRFNPIRALWSSGTAGHQGAYAVMQSDGNFVVYSSTGTALWNSGTAGHPGSYLALQDDGNVVVYSGSKALWNSHTNNRLSDPSFESAPSAPGWYRNNFGTKMNMAAYANASRAHDGVGFLEANTSEVSGSIAQDISAAPVAGQRYVFSIWLRSADGNPFPVCVALWFLGTSNTNGSTCVTVGGTWQDVQAEAVAGSGYHSIRGEVYLKAATRNLDFDTATLVGP
jgi:hypothetical protein